jgi:citrate lyase subunit beta / citryl-CoA lyase
MMRCLLFVPGDSPRKFAKALASDADTLILDLEDSVALAAKPDARRNVAGILLADRQGKALIVRINAFDTGMSLADLAAIMPHAPAAIMLPKSRNADDISELGHYLSALEAAFGLPPESTGILPIVTESADAVLGLQSYRPDPRLRGLMWGAEDLAASLGATANHDGTTHTAPFVLARNLCLMAAARIGVPAVDTICPDIADLARIRAEAREARRDGFTAKAVIHPSHIAAVIEAFQPSPQETLWAERVLKALETGDGVVQLDGQMIDKPHERMARRILDGIPRPKEPPCP